MIGMLSRVVIQRNWSSREDTVESKEDEETLCTLTAPEHE